MVIKPGEIKGQGTDKSGKQPQLTVIAQAAGQGSADKFTVEKIGKNYGKKEYKKIRQSFREKDSLFWMTDKGIQNYLKLIE